MKTLAHLMACVAVSFSLGAAAGEAKPSLVIYQMSQEYEYPVHLGTPPYYSRWLVIGPLVEAAAEKAFQPQFDSVRACDGVAAGDVIVWLKPRLFYNVGARRYFARIKAQFHAANGRHLGNIKGESDAGGDMLALDMEQQSQQVLEAAMRDVAAKFAADGALQQAVAESRAQDTTHSPCAIVAAVPNP